MEGVGLYADSPFLSNDSFGGQAKDIKPSVPDETEIGRRCNCDTRIEERRVFYGIAIEALSPELEHAVYYIAQSSREASSLINNDMTQRHHSQG